MITSTSLTSLYPHRQGHTSHCAYGSHCMLQSCSPSPVSENPNVCKVLSAQNLRSPEPAEVAFLCDTTPGRRRRMFVSTPLTTSFAFLFNPCSLTLDACSIKHLSHLILSEELVFSLRWVLAFYRMSHTGDDSSENLLCLVLDCKGIYIYFFLFSSMEISVCSNL